jgi:hypothetical protein
MTIREQEPVTRHALVFDTECRPMHYSEWRPESQITAYAWKWVTVKGGLVIPWGNDKLYGGVLTQNMENEVELLEAFLQAYDWADLVIGHYIRKHDLPLINDHCLRAGFKPISERPQKLIQDTKTDFVKVKALGLSQDNLAETFELGREEGGTRKHHMSGANWRVANALDEAGRQDAWERVSSDVIQNLSLYQELRQRHALRAPLHWPETVRRHPR